MSHQKKRRNTRRSGRRGFLAPAAIAAVAAVVMVGMVNGLAGSAQPGPPESPMSTPPPSASDAAADEPGGAVGTATAESEQARAAPVPRRLVVPAMGVDTRLVRLGQQEGKKAVRQPPVRRAGWYKGSVRPGEVGVSVIVGYIAKSPTEPGVFARLAELQKSDRISVRGGDGTLAVFTVSEIATYAVGEFPAKKVYGSTDRPELRLITSGGKLRPKDPRGNVVVYAHLVESR